MKHSREYFSKLRPKQISCLPTLSLSFDNKEQLRSLITDYVLHNMESEGKNHFHAKFKAKKVKYPSFTLKVNINDEEREVSLDFVTILRKYLEFQKKNIYRDERIEPLVVDILNFIDEIEEKVKNIIFQIQQQNVKKLEEELLNLIIEKHHKDKQKKNQSLELDVMKRKMVAKHTRISYIDIEDQLKKKEKEFLLEINNFEHEGAGGTRTPSQVMVPAQIGEFGERLLSVIESGQIFQNPQKIQELKKEKLIKFYHSNQLEYLNTLTEIKQNLNKEFSSESPSETSKFLQEWIADITLSEEFYKNRFERQEKKKISSATLEVEILGKSDYDDD